MFKPIILQDEPIEQSHAVRDQPEAYIKMHLQASIRQLQLRAELSKLVRDPVQLPLFRSLYTDEKGLVELRKLVRLFDSVKLSKLQFQLFVVEFFEEEKATLEEFLDAQPTTPEVRSNRISSDGQSKSRQPQSRTSIVAVTQPSEEEFSVPPSILELFCSYFVLIADRLPQLRKLTKKVQSQQLQFMNQYDHVNFQQCLTSLYYRALKVMDSRFTEAFVRSSEFRACCPVVSAFDMKEFLFVMAELKPQVSNKCLRMFFARTQQEGLLPIDKLYFLLCGSTAYQAPTSQPGSAFIQLLECMLTLEEHLEDIRQRVGSRNSNYLVALFNVVLTSNNPSTYTEATEFNFAHLQTFLNRYCSKQPSKNSLRQIWQQMFPQMESVSLRQFCLYFLACE